MSGYRKMWEDLIKRNEIEWKGFNIGEYRKVLENGPRSINFVDALFSRETPHFWTNIFICLRIIYLNG
jgi:hypothetical protein